MNKGAVGKAIAELGVIVVGVLIALFAESAWNDRQDRLKGRQYAARMSLELNKNLDHLQNDLRWTLQACNSAEAALAKMRDTDGTPDPAMMLRLFVSVATFPAPEYHRATYDDLIATGRLSLIDDAVLREQIVYVYTEFFESLSAWRPPKETELRLAVVRTLPPEYIVRVIADCLVDPETGFLAAKLRSCGTIPSSNTPAFWYETLMARPDIEGLTSERAWQVCDFERSMAPVQDRLKSLVMELENTAD
jgi:hypothetical protein